MKEKIAYAVWGILYVLCVGLGTVENAQGIGKVLLILTALIFFIPGIYLLWLGHRENRKILIRVRWISLIWLSLTMCFLVINLFSVLMSPETGSLLHELLALVSAPMFCGQYWSISLFAWACMLFATFIKFPRVEK